MARQKGFGVSPITNTIYYGLQDTEKHMFIGDKVNVTMLLQLYTNGSWVTWKKKKNILLHIHLQNLS